MNVAGNPFAQGDYKSYVVAHLPAITYLDFRLVSSQMVRDWAWSHLVDVLYLEKMNAYVNLIFVESPIDILD